MGTSSDDTSFHYVDFDSFTDANLTNNGASASLGLANVPTNFSTGEYPDPAPGLSIDTMPPHHNMLSPSHSRLTSHSHPVPTFSPPRLTEPDRQTDQTAGLIVENVAALAYPPNSAMSDTITDKDTAIGVTTSGHHRTGSKQQPGLARKPTDIDDNGMINDLSYQTILPASTTYKTHPAPSFVAGPTNGLEECNKRADDSVVLDNNVTTVTAAVRYNATKVTPLRQAHLNTLLTPLIPSAPSSPHDKNREKVDDEYEDPFESFNSGSEQEDEADIDFKGGSVSPSIGSKSYSPTPTAPESDREQRTRKKGQAATVKKVGRSVFGDWPIAAQARKRINFATKALAQHIVGSSYNGSVPWPLGTEASKAAGRGVAVSGIPTFTVAGHDHNTMGPSTGTSTSWMYTTTQEIGRVQWTAGGGAKLRLCNQMFQAEAEAETEAQMLHGIEKDKEKRTSESMHEGTNLSQGVQEPPVQGHENSEVRNGGGWALVVDKDSHGRRVTKWVFAD
ncbi:MAG: hypothetical protein Q9172_000363 [Xanthocarpia lactea]